MTQQVIDIGSAPDDSTGDPLRTSFDKTNDNFTELYAKGATEGLWNFNQTSSDTSTAPVSGRFKTNTGNYRGATQIAIHGITIQGIDRSSTLRTLLVGDLIQCQDKSNAAAWCRYSLQSPPVDHGTWFQLDVTFQADGGVASGDNQEIIFVFTASSGSAAAGAPVGAEYITSVANPTLTAERVLTDTATVTWDRTTAGQIKATAVSSGGIITTVAVQKFTASGSYTPTAAMKYCIIECVGGGAGGGTIIGAANMIYIACGGGSGGYSRKYATAADIGASKTVTVGAGGAGSTTNGIGGAAGGDTSVGALCIAKGAAQAGNWATPGPGGVAGTGDIAAVGAPGNAALQITNTITVFLSGGSGGNSVFGGGGASAYTPSVSSMVNGNAAANYGGGGGGSTSNNFGATPTGGAGSAGIVIITEYI